MFDMKAHSCSQSATFRVTACSSQLLGGVCVVNALNDLFNDRAFIQIGRDVMRCGTCQFDASFMRLVLGLGALEAGQEGVVNIHGPAA